RPPLRRSESVEQDRDMSSAVLTTRSALPDTAVLNQLAERWRSAGIFFACFDREGSVLWHDTQMPRLLSLCLANGSAAAKQISAATTGVPSEHVRVAPPFPGVQMSLVPVVRRRKLAAWVGMLSRTEHLIPSEDLARIAGKASLDV